jgi:hypothetical protein
VPFAVILDFDTFRDFHDPYYGLEKQTEEFKSAIDESHKDMKRHFKNDDELGFEASKPNPEDWSECMEFDSDFQECS